MQKTMAASATSASLSIPAINLHEPTRNEKFMKKWFMKTGETLIDKSQSINRKGRTERGRKVTMATRFLRVCVSSVISREEREGTIKLAERGKGEENSRFVTLEVIARGGNVGRGGGGAAAE